MGNMNLPGVSLYLYILCVICWNTSPFVCAQNPTDEADTQRPSWAIREGRGSFDDMVPGGRAPLGRLGEDPLPRHRERVHREVTLRRNPAPVSHTDTLLDAALARGLDAGDQEPSMLWFYDVDNMCPLFLVAPLVDIMPEKPSAHTRTFIFEAAAFVQTEDGRYFALSASDGSVMWWSDNQEGDEPEDHCLAQPLLLTDNSCVVFMSTRNLRCLSLESGQIQWEARLPMQLTQTSSNSTEEAQDLDYDGLVHMVCDETYIRIVTSNFIWLLPLKDLSAGVSNEGGEVRWDVTSTLNDTITQVWERPSKLVDETLESDNANQTNVSQQSPVEEVHVITTAGDLLSLNVLHQAINWRHSDVMEGDGGRPIRIISFVEPSAGERRSETIVVATADEILGLDQVIGAEQFRYNVSFVADNAVSAWDLRISTDLTKVCSDDGDSSLEVCSMELVTTASGFCYVYEYGALSAYSLGSEEPVDELVLMEMTWDTMDEFEEEARAEKEGDLEEYISVEVLMGRVVVEFRDGRVYVIAPRGDSLDMRANLELNVNVTGGATVWDNIAYIPSQAGLSAITMGDTLPWCPMVIPFQKTAPDVVAQVPCSDPYIHLRHFHGPLARVHDSFSPQVVRQAGIELSLLDGYVSLKCGADGQWQGEDVIVDCRLGRCAAVEAPDDMGEIRLWPSVDVGSDSSVSCPVGYTGNFRRHCNETTGELGPVVRQCEESWCEKEMKNGETWWPKTGSEMEAEVECSDGGVRTRKCLKGGVWEEERGVDHHWRCPMYCEEEGEWERTKEGLELELPCENGFTQSRKCSVGGVWEKEKTVECARSEYGDHHHDGSTDNGEVNHSQSSNSSTISAMTFCEGDDEFPLIMAWHNATVQCTEGVQGIRKAVCHPDGTREIIEDTCQGINYEVQKLMKLMKDNFGLWLGAGVVGLVLLVGSVYVVWRKKKTDSMVVGEVKRDTSSVRHRNRSIVRSARRKPWVPWRLKEAQAREARRESKESNGKWTEQITSPAPKEIDRGYDIEAFSPAKPHTRSPGKSVWRKTFSWVKKGIRSVLKKMGCAVPPKVPPKIVR